MAASAGARGGVVTALTPPEDRSRVIEEFRQRDGDAMALFNFGVLTTGFDAPATRGVVIAPPNSIGRIVFANGRKGITRTSVWR